MSLVTLMIPQESENDASGESSHNEEDNSKESHDEGGSSSTLMEDENNNAPQERLHGIYRNEFLMLKDKVLGLKKVFDRESSNRDCPIKKLIELEKQLRKCRKHFQQLDRGSICPEKLSSLGPDCPQCGLRVDPVWSTDNTEDDSSEGIIRNFKGDNEIYQKVESSEKLYSDNDGFSSQSKISIYQSDETTNVNKVVTFESVQGPTKKKHAYINQENVHYPKYKTVPHQAKEDKIKSNRNNEIFNRETTSLRKTLELDKKRDHFEDLVQPGTSTGKSGVFSKKSNEPKNKVHYGPLKSKELDLPRKTISPSFQNKVPSRQENELHDNSLQKEMVRGQNRTIKQTASQKQPTSMKGKELHNVSFMQEKVSCQHQTPSRKVQLHEKLIKPFVNESLQKKIKSQQGRDQFENRANLTNNPKESRDKSTAQGYILKKRSVLKKKKEKSEQIICEQPPSKNNNQITHQTQQFGLKNKDIRGAKPGPSRERDLQKVSGCLSAGNEQNLTKMSKQSSRTCRIINRNANPHQVKNSKMQRPISHEKKDSSYHEKIHHKTRRAMNCDILSRGNPTITQKHNEPIVIEMDKDMPQCTLDWEKTCEKPQNKIFLQCQVPQHPRTFSNSRKMCVNPPSCSASKHCYCNL